MRTFHRYEPRDPIQAIAPRALLGLFPEPGPPTTEQRDDVSIVEVYGPLASRAGWWTDSYEAIRRRFDEACAAAPPTIVLRIDSPGGEVPDLFDCARYIRTACERAGKRLVAYSSGQLCSAAYALATAAEKIVAATTCEVGSVGVIAARLDQTQADAEMGLKFALVVSGARKGDGCVHQPVSDTELGILQHEVDGLAAELFELVSTHRGIPAEKVAALEAASYRGEDAVAAGLVDELGSFDDLLASLSARATQQGAPRIAASKPATRIVAASQRPKEKMMGHSKPKTAAARGSDLDSRIRRLEALERREEKRQLLEGLTPDLRRVLATKPLDEVRAIVASMPASSQVTASSPTKAIGDVAVAAPTAKHDDGLWLEGDQREQMQRAMGLSGPSIAVVATDRVLMLGVTADEAAIALAKLPPPAQRPKPQATTRSYLDGPSQLPPAQSRAMRVAMGIVKPPAEQDGTASSDVTLVLGIPRCETARVQGAVDQAALASHRAVLERRGADPGDGIDIDSADWGV